MFILFKTHTDNLTKKEKAIYSFLLSPHCFRHFITSVIH